MRGIFITFEGPEGGGKTTQLDRLFRRLREVGVAALKTREPGGTPIGERIRALLLDPLHVEMALQTEVLLFAAVRAQHVAQLLRPALERGEVVLCDRFVDATFAYQGYASGADLEWLAQLTRYATGGLAPDLTILLDLDPNVGLRRKRDDHSTGGGEFNRIDRRELAYHRTVRMGFRARAAAEPQRFLVLDATQPPDQLALAIEERVWQLLHNRGLLPREG